MADPRDTVEELCRFERRGPCTDAERRAAAWVHDDLRARGHEAWVETHWVRPQWALSLALHATLGVVASATAVALPAAGLALALLAAVSLGLEASGRTGLLRLAFPRRATQNVLALAAGDAPLTLLVCARYDAGRRGVLAGDRGRRLAARLRRRLGGRTPGPRAWLAIACGAVGACAAARLAGAEGLALGVAQFLPTVALLGGLAFAGDVAASPLTAGANDGASGAAVALALHEELTGRPPERLAPALLLYGAGESGPLALRAHLRRERLDPSSTVLLEIAACGDGRPVYSAGHPQLRAACERAAALGTGARAPLRRPPTRLPAAVVGCLDADGIVPRARQADDTPEHVDPAALEAALDFALALADALDGELASAHRPDG